MRRVPLMIAPIVLLSIALVASFVTSANATEPPGGTVAYRKSWILCSNQQGVIDIGGAVFLKEVGDSHVTRFTVKWLLYNTPRPTATTLAYRRKTVSSNYFPDDGRTHQWTTPKQTWNGLVAPDAGYTLVAKLTWERPGRRDWNHRFPFVFCS